MKTLPCCVAFTLAGIAVGAVACGGDSGGPSGPQAASVTGIAGDSQIGPTQQKLDFPLSMTLLGSNGQPVQGVTVTWAATPANGATANPSSSVSDVNGVTTTEVTLGNVQDTIAISATVPGIQQPIVFHVLAVNPCSFARVYTIGATVNGSISNTDCNSNGYYNDFYLLDFAAQTGMTINMTGNFDTWIDMYVDNGTQFIPIGFHDDIAAPGNLNSRLQIITAPGNYLLAPNTANTGVTGTYSLTSATHSPAAAGCEQLFVTHGVVLNDNIATTDCPDTTGTGSNGDSVKIIVANGEVLKVAQRSAAVNANLRLFHVVLRANPPDSLELVASNDDSTGTTQNAYISHTVPGAAGGLRLYIIFAGTTGTSQTGAYTLDISANTTLSVMARSRPRSGWGVSLGNRTIPQLGLRRGL